MKRSITCSCGRKYTATLEGSSLTIEMGVEKDKLCKVTLEMKEK